MCARWFEINQHIMISRRTCLRLDIRKESELVRRKLAYNDIKSMPKRRATTKIATLSTTHRIIHIENNVLLFLLSFFSLPFSSPARRRHHISHVCAHLLR